MSGAFHSNEELNVGADFGPSVRKHPSGHCINTYCSRPSNNLPRAQGKVLLTAEINALIIIKNQRNTPAVMPHISPRTAV